MPKQPWGMSKRKRRRQKMARVRKFLNRIAEVEAQRESQQPKPTASQLPDQRAAKLAVIEQFDGYANLRNCVRRIAEARGDWAGIPLPLDTVPLIIEPNYPNAEELMLISAPPEPEIAEKDRGTIRNQWWSDRLRCEIVIFEQDGKIDWGKLHGIHHFQQDLETYSCHDAWGIEQEAAAVNLLGTLVSHRQFKSYMLTGAFIETSHRSGLAYVFRRLRPTVVINKIHSRILTTMCLHPIGYYRGSWAGAMCPTDDVVAHLMLMRGDEHMFWKRANHHHPIRPEAGL